MQAASIGKESATTALTHSTLDSKESSGAHVAADHTENKPQSECPPEAYAAFDEWMIRFHPKMQPYRQGWRAIQHAFFSGYNMGNWRYAEKIHDPYGNEMAQSNKETQGK